MGMRESDRHCDNWLAMSMSMRVNASRASFRTGICCDVGQPCTGGSCYGGYAVFQLTDNGGTHYCNEILVAYSREFAALDARMRSEFAPGTEHDVWMQSPANGPLAVSLSCSWSACERSCSGGTAGWTTASSLICAALLLM